MRMIKKYSGLSAIPNGTASDKITDGCIVLEGGGFRGVYTEGVLDALMKNDINLECTIGISAGALNGVAYVTGQIGRSARVNLAMRHDKKYIGLGAIKENKGITGFNLILKKNDYIKQYGVENLDYDRFMQPNRRFVAVLANCNTGKADYFEKGKCDNIMQAIRASSSLPFVSKSVKINGVPYLDGGCANKIPYDWAITEGYEKIVVIRTRPKDFRYENAESGKYVKAVYRKYPQLCKSFINSNIDYNRRCDELDKLEKDGRVFVIAPSDDYHVGRLEGDMEKMGRWYWLGYNDTLAQIDRLKNYLS